MNRRPPKIKPEEKIKTLLIDGNALFKTGYHGAISDYNIKGEHIGGLFQFITMVRKLIEENLYHRVFVFWDGKFSGKMRYEIYSDYKANRNKDFVNGTEPDDLDQIVERLMVQEYLEELFIRQIEDEIVESDDFIAYFCSTREENEEITICTNDRDLCQLINDNVSIYLCDKKIYVNSNNYSQHFKHHVSNVALIKIISGDNSDNIKGVKGVKETTLLKHFPFLKERESSLEEILQTANILNEERITSKKKPLVAISNILNSVTDGIQGKDLYEINKFLVDLTIPLISPEAVLKIEELRNSCLDPSDRGIKNIYNLMKRDGLDTRISKSTSDFLLPFKKLIEREKKLFNENLIKNEQND